MKNPDPIPSFSCQYLGSFTDVRKLPDESLPEFVFMGRSNVGKSSLINFLTGVKDLARTSSQPGKTQAMNFFQVDQSWVLVDVPGYGYAAVSKTRRQQWQDMIREYLLRRKTLVCAFLLIDASIPPQKSDQEFVEWLGLNQVPFVIVFTKMDKAKKNQVMKHLQSWNEHLRQQWDNLPPIYQTSVEDKRGREEILDLILTTLQSIHA